MILLFVSYLTLNKLNKEKLLNWLIYFPDDLRLKNKKLPSDQQGFLSFSGELRTQAPTTRSQIYQGLVYEVNRPGMTDADRARVKAKDDTQ